MTLPHHAGISTNVNAPPVAATEWNAVIDTLNALAVTSSIVTVCTSGTRPTTGLATGRLIFETDTVQLAEYNGSGWTYPTVPGVSTAWQRKAYNESVVAATTMSTAEVLVVSTSWTASATRRYRIDACGALTNSSGYCSAFRVRWAAGASVTSASNDFLELPMGANTNGFSQFISGFREGLGFTAGQITVGVFAVQTVTGTGGTTKYGNGSAQPTTLEVNDIGT